MLEYSSPYNAHGNRPAEYAAVERRTSVSISEAEWSFSNTYVIYKISKHTTNIAALRCVTTASLPKCINVVVM